MSCKGICYRFKVTKPIGESRYQAGQKRCNTCNVFMDWEGHFCPCCNLKLRLSSRDTKYKEKFTGLQRI